MMCDSLPCFSKGEIGFCCFSDPPLHQLIPLMGGDPVSRSGLELRIQLIRLSVAEKKGSDGQQQRPKHGLPICKGR